MRRTRREIINHIVNALKEIDSSTESIPSVLTTPYTYKTKVQLVYPRLFFHTQLNSFPAICVYPDIQVQMFESNNLGMNTMNMCAKGYVKATNQAHLVIADLTEDIHYVLESMRNRNIDWPVENVQVTSIFTDNGLNDPFGLCEIKFKVIYHII